MALDPLMQQVVQSLLLATIELCSGFVLINSSITVMLRSSDAWMRKVFIVPMVSGVLFIALVVFQILGLFKFRALQHETALLFALYALFAFLISWQNRKYSIFE